MINIEPQSDVKLLKTPLEKDSEHTLSFTSLSDQTSYFLSKVEYSFADFTYVREYQELTVPKSYDEICTCNYLMYRNTGFNTKYFYAFITKMEFVNENMTRIYFEIDSLQTWYFQINYNQVFIEREHVSDDTRGKHTIPENLETGEYVYQFESIFSIGDSHVVMASNINPSTMSATGGNIYGNVYSGVTYYIFSGIDKLQNALVLMASQGKIDGISSLFYCPDFITDYDNATFDSNGVAEVDNLRVSQVSIGVPLTPSTIDTYVPKNNKLFTYPYITYVLSNNSGGAINYRLEDFINSGNNLGTINVKGTITPGGSVRAIPENYKGTGSNNEYGLTLGKFPVCSFPVDSYLNWQTQQSVNIGLSVVENSIGFVSNVATANVSGATGNIGNIVGTISQQYQHSLVPVQARGNLNSGDVTYADSKLTYTGYIMNIKKEYAEIIDNYFTMYGYKVNRLKLPELYSRRNWNYIKTINCEFTGEIPQQDMEKIRTIFNNGITFWHNANNYLDYSANNDII